MGRKENQVSLFRGKVNAHLGKARWLLQSLKASRQESDSSRVGQAALQESCAYQLQLTLENFLREIAENYQLANPEQVQSSTDLEQALLAADKSPAELAEIRTSQSEGWLGQMNRAFQQIGKASSASSPTIQMTGMIQTKSLESTDLDASNLELWFNNLKELVDRQREMMVEC